MKTKNPNVILIMCDQMRGDAMGAAGNKFVQTPNIDWLAQRGSIFEHGYTASPSCVPARASLWSGKKNQWISGFLGIGPGQGSVPNNFEHTFAGELTNAGYRTHMIGKGHFTPQRTSMGFETRELDESGRMPTSDYRRWFEEQAPAGVTPDDHGVDWNSWHARPWHTEERLHPTSWTMTRALDFLSHYDEKRPFFLNISFARPHSPYVPPQHYFDMYYPNNVPEPYVGDWADVHDVPDEEKADPNAWQGRMTPDQIKRARAGYYGEISFIDTQIGRLHYWLRKHPEVARNTWIIFTADHGDMQGDHHLWRKTYAYEGSVRIPFIIAPPKDAEEPQRKRIQEVATLYDIMPTVLSMAEVPVPEGVDGKSLLPLMHKADPNWRKYLHGEHPCSYQGYQTQFVTDGLRKFVWLPHRDVEQFFDLELDPGECTDLINDPARAREIELWRSRLIHELEQKDCGWVRNGKLCNIGKQ